MPLVTPATPSFCTSTRPGASVAGIARHLGLDRKIAHRWLRRDGPPTWAKPRRPSVIDPYRTHLDRRWAKGCRNGAVMARELDRLGAGIKLRVVRAWATERRRSGAGKLDRGIADAPPPWKLPTTRQIARLLSSDAGAIEYAEALRRWSVVDATGITNTIALPWSTGLAEGQISRLKMIKRQMHDCAGFELLRQRVLNAAPPPATRNDREPDFGAR